MALGEGESALFGLFTNESANVFDPVGTVLEGLGAGSIIFKTAAECLLMSPHSACHRS
jgi:hypothetical protein